jgi:hypothetical protein
MFVFALEQTKTKEQRERKRIKENVLLVLSPHPYQTYSLAVLSNQKIRLCTRDKEQNKGGACYFIATNGKNCSRVAIYFMQNCTRVIKCIPHPT